MTTTADLILRRQALQEELAEVEAALLLPDIELPNLDCFCGDDFHPPFGEVVAVDGVTLYLVNWRDYRGWEVRIAHRPADGKSGGYEPQRLGYLTAILSAKDDGSNAYRMQLARGHVTPEFDRVDDCLRYAIADETWGPSPSYGDL